MQLEQMTVRLRRRSPWEALDLGRVLLRHWSGRVYRAWFATYWPVGVVILLVMWPWPEYAMLVLWWLKPLFDRVLLFVFSRSVFGDECRMRDLLRALPRLLRGPGVVSGLTLRRGSLARSLLLPVWQLEQQTGARARARFRLLSRRCRAQAVWLTFFCANMSTILLVSIVIVLLVLVPGNGQDLSPWQWFGGERSTAGYFAGNLMFMLAETVVEPLYVASGFSLYLNRRSELEAWDIELAFRRLAERQSPTAITTSLLVVFLALAVPPAAPVHAEEVPQPPSMARQTIDAVLADPVFGQVKNDLRWRWRWQPSSSPVDNLDDHQSNWIMGILRILEILAEWLRSLLWIFSGFALAAAIFLVLRHRQAGLRVRTAPMAPEFLFGLDLRPTSLPADVAAAAHAALDRGDSVEALSLLYRGALVALMHQRQIDFASGDTENDCLRRIAGRVPEALDRRFNAIVETWRMAAYGRLSIPVERIEELLAGWDVLFGKPASRP
ncbi:MAG TPA: DUF4129 domain-containing protein [Accumulibacter sp.]|uniref:DUF4129 domain-containing protein n=2 Tax=Candidatus Accumulibacter TaxID=327159 RepID=A0A7D5NAA3_9PROT|nr:MULTISPECIES: DUF4129 domain-containing protein [Candidatus Accumulibacter]QLH49487.1 MAG: DUF4129 domain-containing protein [Candidatus Accumulibacter cognatus]MBL8400760.1 DUF4129 domain-containing protein [Accumulibacter sp.]MBN8517153.1 DUF4129 domain-containing protein [Accumulibacter sp.]MBO3709254.1 DUF4129 domain-containing protein [Accumulibacter sp.]MCC2867172.1 DUF4129 domain-containing protein [Candidatus Accumulibacter phosphatis]